MSFEHSVSVLRRVVSDAHVTFLTCWCDEDSFIRAIWVQGAEALRVIAGINSVNQPQICEVIDINSVL